jgi:hypothetical protein
MARDPLTLLFSAYPPPLPSPGLALRAWAFVLLSAGTAFVTLGIFARVSQVWRWWVLNRKRSRQV